jgi:hypothetical protein
MTQSQPKDLYQCGYFVTACPSEKGKKMAEPLANSLISRRLPKVLLFVQPCPLISGFEESEKNDRKSTYDEERQLSVSPDGIPLYCARYPTPPTSCTTPGHTIPAGYTSTGKYKPAKYVPSKTDKRAGK